MILSAGLYLLTSLWCNRPYNALGLIARLEVVLKLNKMTYEIHNKGNWKVKSFVFINLLAESDCFDGHVSVGMWDFCCTALKYK